MSIYSKFKLRVFFTFFILNSHCFFAQNFSDSVKLKQLRDELLSEVENFTANPALNNKQNDLLKNHLKKKIEYEVGLLNTKQVYTSGFLYDYVHSIFEKLLKANPSIVEKYNIVINKSNEFNAFTMGDNIAFVNIGLLYHLKNENEIALVIAHELAHDVLDHSKQDMIWDVLFETDENLKDSIRNIMNDKYGTVTALNKLLVPRIYKQRKISRIYEYEADSLGYIFMKSAGFAPSSAIAMFQFFQMLEDHSEPKIDLTACTAIEDFPSIVAKEKSYSHESSLGQMIDNDSLDLDSYLSTHPYDIDRFHRLANKDSLNMNLNEYVRNTDSVYASIYREITTLSIDKALQNEKLTDAFYYTCHFIIDFPKDKEAYKILTTLLESLSFLKDRHTSGKYLKFQSIDQSESMNHLNYFLTSLSPKECYDLALQSKKKMEVEMVPDDTFGSLEKMLTLLKNEKYDLFYLQWTQSKDKIKSSKLSWMLNEIEQYLYVSQKVKQIKPNKNDKN